MHYLDTVQFESYVAACTRNAGVSVRWDEPTATPRTDGRIIYIPQLTSVTSNDWLTRIRYFVKHETSHIVYSDFDYLNEKRPRGLLALINNLLEDHRIDYRNDMLYEGDISVSNEFWELYADDIRKNLLSDDAKLKEQQNTTLPLFIWDAYCRDWINNAEESFIEVEQTLDTINRERLNKLITYTERLLVIRESGSVQDVYQLAVDILEDVYEQKSEDYEGDDKDDSKGTSSKAGDGTDGSAPIDDAVDRLINVSDLMKELAHEHKPSRTGVHIQASDVSASTAYVIPKSTDYVVVRFPELHDEVTGSVATYFKPRSVIDGITSNSVPLANKLRIKLQTRSRDRYEYGKTKGKLHNGSLHKLLSGDDKTQSKVFRKRVVSDTLDTCVTLLVDCSGSMQGDKFEMACAGAGAMSAALKPLNIKHSILGFTNTVGRKEDPIVWVFTDYDERVSTLDLVSRFKRASACLWQNSDGDAIAYAHRQLMQRREKRKVLLVLSDGSPAGREWAGDSANYTRDAIKATEKSGVDVYGIGILDSNVRRFYEKNVVVNSLSELTPAILSVLDRSI